MAADAIEGYLECLEEDGLPLPESDPVAVPPLVDQTRIKGESDVYLFAGITGDLASNHVNEEVMKRSSYGRRIAHGALLIGFMSTTSTLMIEQSGGVGAEETPVSLGYDRIRFLTPVFIGDTVSVTYRIAEVDPTRRRSRADIAVTNQDGTLVALGQHLMKWVPNPTAVPPHPPSELAR